MSREQDGRTSKQGIWDSVEFSDRPRSEGRQTQPPPSLRGLLRKFGFRPRKRLGQNFLADEEILGRIVDTAEVEASDEVLEVGPGLGTLTRHLAERAGRLVAVELDTQLARIVSEAMADRGNVTVINENVLDFDHARYFRHRAFKVVGNLPYYVTSPIMRHFLASDCQPLLMVVMLQKEVAERIIARPGDMSLLAVSVQYYAEPTLVRLVEAGAFYPPPKVDSAIVRLDVLPRPAVDVNQENFFRLVAAGFSQARKQLHNSLAQRFWMKPGQAQELLTQAGIDPKRRAETLSLEEWATLCRVFEEAGVLKPPPEASDNT